MTNDKKIIIFDMDGVIFDTTEVGRDFFLKRHPGVTKEMYEEKYLEIYSKGSEKYSHLKIQKTKEEEEKEIFDYNKKKIKSPIFKGMDSLLRSFHNMGFLLVLNTNAFPNNCLPLLESANIKGLFDFITTAETSKNKVEKFELIEDRYKARKKDYLFITDTVGDVKEANIAEIKTIAVTWGIHNKDIFEREKESNLIGIASTVEELDNLIKKYYKGSA